MSTNNLKVRLNVWFTSLPAPFDIQVSMIDGMESQGWVFVTSVEQVVDLSDLKIDTKALKEKALNDQMDRINDKYDQEKLVIEDSLRTLKEIK